MGAEIRFVYVCKVSSTRSCLVVAIKLTGAVGLYPASVIDPSWFCHEVSLFPTTSVRILTSDKQFELFCLDSIFLIFSQVSICYYFCIFSPDMNDLEFLLGDDS